MPNNDRPHACLNGEESNEYSWWEHDARGIPLCRVCDKCRKQKLSGYRPEILSGYDQSDVNEQIEPEDGDELTDDVEDYYGRLEEF